MWEREGSDRRGRGRSGGEWKGSISKNKPWAKMSEWLQRRESQYRASRTCIPIRLSTEQRERALGLHQQLWAMAVHRNPVKLLHSWLSVRCFMIRRLKNYDKYVSCPTGSTHSCLVEVQAQSLMAIRKQRLTGWPRPLLKSTKEQ